MIIPLQITFHNIPPSEAVEAKIRSLVDKLEHFYNRITSCRVIVDAPHRHQRNGKFYQIRIDITVPTGEIVVKRNPPEHQSHEDIYVAIRDAFDAAKRKLQDHISRLRQETKTHAEQPHGQIASLFSDEGYGFIETPDGSEVYFHSNSLFNGDFEQLQVGDEVRFAEEEGDKGLQASTVRLIGKHHLQS
jgi:ribosomal subunit interface protein